MNIPRKQMNKYNSAKDPDNWNVDMWATDNMTYREQEEQKKLLKTWERAAHDPNLRDYEVAELEMQRRISAATEGDTGEARTQERIKEFKAAEKLDQWRRGQVKAEHEEDFIKELQGQSEKYSEAVQRARKSVGL